VELPWLTIDPQSAASAIGPRTKAVVVVYLYGQPADLTRLQQLCDQHGLALIEDCAQAHGAAWSRKPAGSFGSVACFSFYPTKNLGIVGDGGMVVTNVGVKSLNGTTATWPICSWCYRGSGRVLTMSFTFT